MRNFDNFRGGIEKWMEKQCLKNADYITALTEFTMESFRRLSPPDKPASDFFTVPMGFALEDFINFPPPPPPDDKIFRIVYTGMFYDQHGPQYFFSGLKSAATANDDFRKSTEIIIAGTMPENYLTLLKEEPLKSMVKLLPYQDHDKTIELMSKADVLYLTLTSGMTEIIPGKLFEYLAARRPILATIPLKGITAQYLRRFEGNLMTESEDVDGIKRALLEMFDRYKTGGLKVDYTLNDLNEFTWKTQAAKMAEILDKASKFSER
ncbi:MAG: glycosyltransferase [FCB group bacterium]|nr:glycosyltransferase [FCB group bacterium]